jgi:uncharacterized protein
MKHALVLYLLFAALHAEASTMEVVALRLSPGQDIKRELDQFISHKKIRAASILSAVGSLSKAHVRFANKSEGTTLTGPFEIISLSGTTGIEGSHFHIALADGEGKTLGGHLLEGNVVYTTLELVLGVYPQLDFKRTHDPKSGYKELDVHKKP